MHPSQAAYTFPVGVTTLWWYAPNQGHSKRAEFGDSVVEFVNATEAGVEFSGEVALEDVVGEEDSDFDGTVYTKSNGEKIKRIRFN